MTVGHSGRMKRHGFSPEQTAELRERVKKGDVASLLQWYDDCAEVLRELYDKPNLTHIGDKNPYFYTSSGFTEAITEYPKIWTIRDPRAVWYSGKSKRKNYLGAFSANAKHFLARMDDSTLVVRFEDLVLTPESVMEKVFDFLGVSHDKSYLDHKSTEYDRRFKWNPNSLEGFDPSQLDKWKRGAIPKKVMKMDMVKKIMRTFGYE